MSDFNSPSSGPPPLPPSWLQDVDWRLLWEAVAVDAARPTLVTDLDGYCLHCNDGAAKLLGGDRVADVLGKTVYQLLAAPVASEFTELVRRTISRQRPTIVFQAWRGKSLSYVIRPLQSAVVPPVVPPRSLVMWHYPAARHLRSNGTYEIVDSKHNDLGVLGTLSPREREVLELIALGLSTNEIARKLHRTVRTVETHRSALGRKLGVRNRVELTRIALELVGLDHRAAEIHRDGHQDENAGF